jgi:hypothetical protein
MTACSGCIRIASLDLIEQAALRDPGWEAGWRLSPARATIHATIGSADSSRTHALVNSKGCPHSGDSRLIAGPQNSLLPPLRAGERCQVVVLKTALATRAKAMLTPRTQMKRSATRVPPEVLRKKLRARMSITSG